MRPPAPSDQPFVLRTDFSEPSAWAAIRSEIGRPVDGFHAYVTFVDDRSYEDLDPA